MFSYGEFSDQALIVGPINENFDPMVPPATGEEYLQRVVLEASKFESVTSHHIDSARINKQTVYIDDSSIESPVVTPSLEWQRCQVADFSAVRQKLARQKQFIKPVFPLPLEDEEKEWYSLCFGNITAPIEKGASNEGTPPLLTIMLSMNQQTIGQLLEYHVEWLEAKSSLSTQQGRWLYALLACLELPLTPEICSLLRTLARVCSRIRATLKSADDPAMTPLSLLICLVANYFRQMDLADT